MLKLGQCKEKSSVWEIVLDIISSQVGDIKVFNQSRDSRGRTLSGSVRGRISRTCDRRVMVGKGV